MSLYCANIRKKIPITIRASAIETEAEPELFIRRPLPWDRDVCSLLPEDAAIFHHKLYVFECFNLSQWSTADGDDISIGSRRNHSHFAFHAGLSSVTGSIAFPDSWFECLRLQDPASKSSDRQ